MDSYFLIPTFFYIIGLSSLAACFSMLVSFWSAPGKSSLSASRQR